jgi:prevent-host-death family protein
MRTASVTEAKANLSRLLDFVRSGESVTIVRHGRPIARLEPIGAAESAPLEGVHADLVRAGVVRRGTEAPGSIAMDSSGPKLRPGKGLLDALLADREDGR